MLYQNISILQRYQHYNILAVIIKEGEVFETFEFSGKINEDLIKKSFIDKLKFKDRKKKVHSVKFKIINLFDKFDY